MGRPENETLLAKDDYLLNPGHHDFERLAIEKEMEVALDVRLFR